MTLFDMSETGEAQLYMRICVSVFCENDRQSMRCVTCTTRTGNSELPRLAQESIRPPSRRFQRKPLGSSECQISAYTALSPHSPSCLVMPIMLSMVLFFSTQTASLSMSTSKRGLQNANGTAESQLLLSLGKQTQLQTAAAATEP